VKIPAMIVGPDPAGAEMNRNECHV
jgi:hypothetical protein